MSLYDASNQPTLVQAAIAYFYEGLSVLPLTGKQSLRKWEERQTTVAIPETIHTWNKRGWLKNIGIVCGQVSHNLVVMDLDGLAAVEAFEKEFPYLLDTFTVQTGSGHGKHLYYRVSSLPPTTRIGYPNHQGIELRANGCYVVAPPSIHPDTHMPYRAAFSAPIKEVPHLEDVKRWIYAQLARKNGAQPVAQTNQRTIVGVERWAQAAFDYECRDVRIATEGRRNDQLFISARNLGQIVGDNQLPESTVIAGLLRSALSAGLSEQEALATIHSGITKGIAEPRSLQWQRRNK
jgi:hypothetical protein